MLLSQELGGFSLSRRSVTFGCVRAFKSVCWDRQVRPAGKAASLRAGGVVRDRDRTELSHSKPCPALRIFEGRSMPHSSYSHETCILACLVPGQKCPNDAKNDYANIGVAFDASSRLRRAGIDFYHLELTKWLGCLLRRARPA